jgi:hypothetical protein
LIVVTGRKQLKRRMKIEGTAANRSATAMKRSEAGASGGVAPLSDKR